MGRLGQCGEAEGVLHAIGFRFEVHSQISEDLKKSLAFFSPPENFFSQPHQGSLLVTGV